MLSEAEYRQLLEIDERLCHQYAGTEDPDTLELIGVIQQLLLFYGPAGNASGRSDVDVGAARGLRGGGIND